MPHTLGPFEIREEIARGGMASVFAARHLLEGFDAAVKVVPPAPSQYDLMLSEVRTTAGLNHPSIVAIYDYGQVSAVEASASEGRFAPGGLWFAMERATGGTLETTARPRNWPELRRVLLEILDALAHAHARGCVHRDLKPGNVLVTKRDKATSYLLADFGIAHVVDPNARVPETTDSITAPAAGTPLYMAPEQIQARWRDQGPWTDLYSLACMAWELATGEPLFDGESSIHIAMAHLSSEPGGFTPRFAVPIDFGQWLRTLLQKDTRARYDRAALAAAVLAELPAVAGDDATIETGTNPSLPTLDSMPTFRLPSVHLRAIRRSDALLDSGIRPTVSHNVPSDWRPTRPPHPVGERTGLALFGVRDIGVQGREPERDVLWRTVRQAEDGKCVAACLIRGGEGLGKSRLMRWLGVRVDELGVGSVLRASHSRMPGPSSGLSFALARHFGSVGLDRAATRERIASETSSQADALTEVISPVADGEAKIRFGSPSERHRVISDYLVELGRRRPTVLLVDDAQWGSDALGLVQFLLHEQPPAPIAVVVAVDSGALNEHPLAMRRFQALWATPRTERIELQPLSRSDHQTLVREQARLRPSLADDLVTWSGGDTNYSFCLLGDWIDRGVLMATADGYGFAPREQVPFPRDLREAWGARLDRFCARFAMPARIADCLAVAAVLGTEVDAAEWKVACALRDLECEDRLVPSMIDAGLAEQTELGFHFTQGAIAGTLRDRVQRAGALHELHEVCAQAIDRAGAGGSIAERRGIHLLRANKIEEALRDLRVALDARMETSSYDEAIAIADLWLASATEPTSEDALLVRAQRADAYRFRGDDEFAEAEANMILELAEQFSSARARGEGLRVLAGLEHERGRIERGIRAYTDAIGAYRSAGDTHGVARAVHGRGWLHLNRSEIANARADFKLGVELAARHGAALDGAWSSQGLAEAAIFGGDLALAEETARRAVDEFERLGSRSGRGMALATLGNLLAADGRFDEARTAYDAAIDLLSSFQSQLVSFALAHRVAFELELGDDALLRQYIQRAEEAPLTPAFRVVIAIATLVMAAQERDRHRQLSMLRDGWDEVASHPLVRHVAVIATQRSKDPELAEIIGSSS